MIDPLNNASLFLVSTLFDLYLFVLMIRLILCWVRGDYFNPLSQFVTKLTHPIIVPLRRIIPTYFGIEFATVFVMLTLEILKFYLMMILTTGFPHVAGIIILALADLLKIFFNTFFYAILLQALLSWVQPGFSPIGELLRQITAPIMHPIQRFMPPVAGFDLSPIPALILLQLMNIILVTPIMSLGMGLL